MDLKSYQSVQVKVNTTEKLRTFLIFFSLADRLPSNRVILNNRKKINLIIIALNPLLWFWLLAALIRGNRT